MPGGATSVRVQPENAERPRRAPSPEAVAALKEAASALDVEELLALCYSFQKDSFRLGVYLDVLRRKGGQKAQAAACLICFDLARRGERSFEGEFLALVPVMHAFLDDSEGTRPLDPLIGESPYLRALSSELEALLRTMDPRWDHGGADQVVDLDQDVVEIELLDEDDLLEVDLGDLDEVASQREEQRARWHEALERFFGVDTGIRSMFQRGGQALSVFGFFAESKGELARVEALRDSARSYADAVPEAAELLPLVELFLASHMRAKNLFGRRSRARDATLAAALEHFTALERPPEHGAWLEPPTSTPASWEKVAEIVLDYISWLGSIEGAERMTPAQLASAYVNADRPQPPPPRLAEEGAPRRRR